MFFFSGESNRVFSKSCMMIQRKENLTHGSIEIQEERNIYDIFYLWLESNHLSLSETFQQTYGTQNQNTFIQAVEYISGLGRRRENDRRFGTSYISNQRRKTRDP